VTHTIHIRRLFAGQITAQSSHTVTSAVGLARVVRGYTQDRGHGMRLEVSYACALDLGLAESGGSLWLGATELCQGCIILTPEERDNL
jgi:hypothetical protein